MATPRAQGVKLAEEASLSDLRDRLARLSPARLRALAEAWSVPHARPPTAEDLAAALQDPFVVKRRLARLTDRQLDILDQLDRATYPVTGHRLAADLGLSFETLTPDLRALADLLLIRRAAFPQVPQPAAEVPPVGAHSRAESVGARAQSGSVEASPQAESSGGSPPSKPSETPADLSIEIWPRLRPIVHQVLDRRRSVRGSSPIRRPGSTSVRPAARRGEPSAGQSLVGELERRGGRAPVEDLIDRLGPATVRAEYLAGLADGSIDEAFDNGIWWLIVRDPEPDSAQARPVRDEGTALLWDLLALADQIERAGLPLGAAEWTVRSDQRTRLEKLLRGSAVQPEIRLQWLIRLTVGLGLAEPAGRFLEGTGRLLEWAELGFAAQAARVVSLWQDDLRWAEPTPPGRWGAILDRPRLRHRLFDHLLALRPGDWIASSELVRTVAGDPSTGLPARWTDVAPAQVQSLVRTMLELPLGWLGCLAFRPGDRGEEVTLTNFGALALPKVIPRSAPEGAPLTTSEAIQESPRGERAHNQPTREEPARKEPTREEPTLVVQGDLEVICFESPSSILARVLRATELVEPGAISLHRLTRDALWSALDRGETVPDLLAALAAHSRYPVPNSVATALEDWATRYRAVEVRPVTLVEFDPPEGLDALDPDSPLHAFLDRRLGPGLATLRPDADFAAFQQLVQAAGFRLRHGGRQ